MQQTQTYYQEVQTAFPGQNPLFLPLILFPGIYKGIKRVTIVHCWLQDLPPCYESLTTMKVLSQYTKTGSTILYSLAWDNEV